MRIEAGFTADFAMPERVGEHGDARVVVRRETFDDLLLTDVG